VSFAIAYLASVRRAASTPTNDGAAQIHSDDVTFLHAHTVPGVETSHQQSREFIPALNSRMQRQCPSDTAWSVSSARNAVQAFVPRDHVRVGARRTRIRILTVGPPIVTSACPLADARSAVPERVVTIGLCIVPISSADSSRGEKSLPFITLPLG